MPLLANTPIRRAREWFSSWPGLPRFFEEDSYSIPKSGRLKPNCRSEEKIRKRRARENRTEGNGSKRDQRVRGEESRG